LVRITFIDIGTVPLEAAAGATESSDGTRPVLVALGTTHHGIRAEAGSVNSALERIIEELMTAHPDAAF
jgi:hypothetical protein